MHNFFTLKTLRLALLALIIIAICAGLCTAFWGSGNISVFNRAVMV